MSINNLPPELLQIIFGICDEIDQATISVVCHRWAAAVQRLLLRRTWLKLSDSEQPTTAGYGPARKSSRVVLDKTILLESDRKYTGFRVEWGYYDTDRNEEMINELLDVCQERFSVQRLNLSAPPQRRLIRFFENRQQWLQTLVELNVTLAWSKPSSGCELSLPSLKQLSWSEPSSLASIVDRPFALTAPELCRLKVVIDFDAKRHDWNRRPLIFTLQLVSCPKLDNVAFEGVNALNHRHIDSFEPFLQKLKILSLSNCEVADRLYEKCTNLKELTFRYEQAELDVKLQISPALSANLESLTVIGMHMNGLTLFEEAVFTKLRRLYLQEIEFESDYDCVSLVAPQLTTFICLSSHHSLLSVPQPEQIRTMRIDLDNSGVEPPPNVTEFHLRFHYTLDTKIIRQYLPNFPNLRRLTLNSDPCPSQFVYCKFFAHLPKLESFTAHQLTLRLVDCKKFARLKSLILSHCIIREEAHDEHVQLTALGYVRIEQVTIDGARRDQFPIRVNDRQPPIDIVRVTRGLGLNVFHSRNFKSTICEELEPEFEG